MILFVQFDPRSRPRRSLRGFAPGEVSTASVATGFSPDNQVWDLETGSLRSWYRPYERRIPKTSTGPILKELKPKANAGCELKTAPRICRTGSRSKDRNAGSWIGRVYGQSSIASLRVANDRIAGIEPYYDAS